MLAGADRAEVLVDSITYVVWSSAGPDVGGESVFYVAGWARTAREAIREYAATIDAIARRVADTLAPEPEQSTNAVTVEAMAA